MKLTLTAVLAAFGIIVSAADAETNSFNIIPQPAQLTPRPGVFTLDSRPQIVLSPGTGEASAEFLARRLRKATGGKIEVGHQHKSTGSGNIWFTLDKTNTALGDEGYELQVMPDAVVIKAPTETGLFYGAQTLLQLFPPDIFSPKPAHNGSWTIPCVDIVDKPRFRWRGLMLDVSRHFFTKNEVETILDTLALYKINTFHWHLVDDNGWRIEIKKYPKLTGEDAWRKGIDYDLDPKSSTAYRADGKYGGFYTQTDIREVVRYAAARHITIVPEIEMPGHSAGALAAYPEYSCFGGPYSLDGSDAIFCPGNEGTFTFLEGILDEVFQLFPGPFIHVGGDEVSTANWQKCPKCQERMKEEHLQNPIQLEGYLIQRIEKYANAHGKRVIGWSEIRTAGLAQNAAVMDWIGGAAEAAQAGHDTVLSPASPVDYSYFDHYQSQDQAAEPKAIGGFLPLKRVYQFEPIPAGLAPELQSHILGAQGNLWTEFVPNIRHAEYMIFPRECAMAEVTWSPKESRNWDDFLARVLFNQKRLDELGVNYRHDPTKTGEKK